MEEFLKECNLMVPAKKFVIVTKGDIPGYCIKLFKQYSNIRFFSHTGFEFVTDAIIRDIPIFDGWLEDGKNVYKAKDVDDFEFKIKEFMSGKLKSVSKNAYPVAIERDQKNIGKQLKSVYEEVLKQK